MSEHELSILLRLRDEASKQIEQFGTKIETEMNKAGKAMIDFGREINKIGKDMTFVGAAITGPLALAFKTTAGFSVEASEALKRLDDSSKAFQITIGSAMLPIVERVSNVISALTQYFEQLNPKMRDGIIQGALLTGILLTLGGALTYIIGKIVDLGGRILKFAAAHPILLLISAALIYMILNWQKMREVAIPVLNAIEIGAEMVAIGFQKIVAFMADAMAFIVTGLEKVLYYLSLIPGPQQEVFEAMREGAQSTKEFFQTISEASKATIANLEQDMANTMESGKGRVASFVDEGIIKIQTLVDFFNNNMVPGINAAMQNFSQNFSQVFTQAYEQAQNLGQQSAQIFVSSIQQLSTGIGTAVADMVLKGRNFGESMKAMGMQMAQSFISSIVSMVVQFLIFQAIQAAFFPLIISMGSATAGALGTIWAPVAALVSLATMGGNAIPAGVAIASTTAIAYAAAAGSKFHQGGLVYAHSGLAVDEVPAILQTGEGVLSRRGMKALGGPSELNSLNKGRGSSQVTYVTNNNSFHLHDVTMRDERDIQQLAEEIFYILERSTDRLR